MRFQNIEETAVSSSPAATRMRTLGDRDREKTKAKAVDRDRDVRGKWCLLSFPQCTG